MRRYRLWIENSAIAEVRELPGHVRQRVRRAIAALYDYEDLPELVKDLRE